MLVADSGSEVWLGLKGLNVVGGPHCKPLIYNVSFRGVASPGFTAVSLVVVVLLFSDVLLEFELLPHPTMIPLKIPVSCL